MKIITISVTLEKYREILEEIHPLRRISLTTLDEKYATNLLLLTDFHMHVVIVVENERS